MRLKPSNLLVKKLTNVSKLKYLILKKLKKILPMKHTTINKNWKLRLKSFKNKYLMTKKRQVHKKLLLILEKVTII